MTAAGNGKAAILLQHIKVCCRIRPNGNEDKLVRISSGSLFAIDNFGRYRTYTSCLDSTTSSIPAEISVKYSSEVNGLTLIIYCCCVVDRTKTGSPALRFNMDSGFDERHSQLEIFNTLVKPLIVDFFEGFNCAIFTYGQTGSGKIVLFST